MALNFFDGFFEEGERIDLLLLKLFSERALR